MSSDRSRYRLIMVVGSSPGAGKSTFSDFIYRRLVAERLPVEWFYESDVFRYEPVRRFGETFDRAPPDLLQTFREGAQFVVDLWRDSPGIRVLDSYLPGYFWLLHAVPLDELQTLGDDLWQLLSPLDPLIVYCRADVGVAWYRAKRQRGDAWGERLWRHITSWNTPLYPGAPMRTENDVLDFFAWLDNLGHQLIQRWPGDVVTVNTLAPRAQVEAQILLALGLPPVAPPQRPPPEELQQYVGSYVRDGGDGPPVTVSLVSDTLHASLFWDSGTALDREDGDLFRVRAGSATVRFLRTERGAISGLTYRSFHSVDTYMRRT
jgi:hypothetical protein